KRGQSAEWRAAIRRRPGSSVRIECNGIVPGNLGSTTSGVLISFGGDVGQPILAAAAFRGGSALDHGNRSDCVSPQRSRLKGGQDWLPHVREDDGQGHFSGEHAPGVVAAKGDHGYSVPGPEVLVDIFGVGLAARQTRGTLGHRGARGVETTERQDIQLAHKVDGGSRDELLLELVVGYFGRIAGALLQTVGPLVKGRAVAVVAEGAEAGGSGRPGGSSGDVARRGGSRSVGAGARPVGVQVGVTGGVRYDVRNRNPDFAMDLAGHQITGD